MPPCSVVIRESHCGPIRAGLAGKNHATAVVLLAKFVDVARERGLGYVRANGAIQSVQVERSGGVLGSLTDELRLVATAGLEELDTLVILPGSPIWLDFG